MGKQEVIDYLNELDYLLWTGEISGDIYDACFAAAVATLNKNQIKEIEEELGEDTLESMN